MKDKKIYAICGFFQGLDSGGIDDETYSAYDKPWRAQDNIQQHIYRPSKLHFSGKFDFQYSIFKRREAWGVKKYEKCL